MEEKVKIRCIVCGSTENVNFEGKCKKCYEDSIVVHENTQEDREEFENETRKIILEKNTLLKISSFIHIYCCIMYYI